MQLVQKVNQQCAQNLPYYSEVTNYTSQKYNEGLTCFNNFYDCSAKQARNYQRMAKQFQVDILWMLSQATDDFLEFVEERLGVQSVSTQQVGRPQRVKRIFNKVKEQNFQPQIEKFMQMNQNMMRKGQNFNKSVIIPLYLRVRATVEVSRQIIMEAFTARLSDLKMTYKYSRDHITMYWNGQVKEQKIAEKIKEKFGELREFTVSFAQKGMEIRINKQDLMNNYHRIMSKLSELMQEVGEKSAEQWSETKNKTVDLYQMVLRRIKQKQRAIQIQYKGQSVEQPNRPSPDNLEERVKEPVSTNKQALKELPKGPIEYPKQTKQEPSEGENKEVNNEEECKKPENNEQESQKDEQEDKNEQGTNNGQEIAKKKSKKNRKQKK